MYSLKQKICIAINSLELCSTIKATELFDIVVKEDNFIGDLLRFKSEILTILNEKQFNSLSISMNTSYLDSFEKVLKDNDIVALTYFCDKYPQKLRCISDPPLVIYCKGNIDLLDKLSLSIVGSRKNSPYGRKVVEMFVPELVQAGFTIISGLATGIDGIAHEQTLKANGSTIAVLGSGFNNIYPPSNSQLARNIASNGLLISEYLPNVIAQKYYFPKRNRIVSGLCEGLLVVEAGEKSGVFSTVEYALEQGKNLFVVPNDIFSFTSFGSNDILKRLQGALVTQPKDIIDSFNIKYKMITKVKVILSIEEQIIVNILKDGKKHYNELLQKSGIGIADINYLLSEMELKDMLAKLPQNFYMLTMENV